MSCNKKRVINEEGESLANKRVKTEAENENKPVSVPELYGFFKQNGAVKGLELLVTSITKRGMCDKPKLPREFEYFEDKSPEILEFFPLFVLCCYFTQEAVNFLELSINEFSTLGTL